ncbi:hypothetical protein NLG97_g9688 [Lecanicillium saksenae]|uniref:Uncharacterized protein n=1 Tax=Lecanicillium saksenae TaxID=468837 RepID=A0ACC1QFU0_9HYPO|nr:hypothetical protein NLG97_g9688 [Lecanicillium saksenae]
MWRAVSNYLTVYTLDDNDAAMSFLARRSFRYQLVDEGSEAEKQTQSSNFNYNRFPWLLSLVIGIFAFLFGALFGVFILAPQPAADLQRQPPTPKFPGIARPDIDINVISQTFWYNRTFGEAPDHKGTAEAWESIVPLGQGTVRFPHESQNLYTLSVVHQLHCLWSIHGSLYSTSRNNHAETSDAHMRHCFDYIRQGLMCASDTSLEPVDPKLGGVTGWGNERVCRDYQQVVAWAEDHRVSDLRGFQETPHHHRK